MREVERVMLKRGDWCKQPPFRPPPPAEAVETFHTNLNILDIVAWSLNKSPSGKPATVHKRHHSIDPTQRGFAPVLG
jgi:hypothetical protein